MTSLYTQFLDGFAIGANLLRSEAESQWTAWSMQLPDGERRTIERGGSDAGLVEGQRYALEATL